MNPPNSSQASLRERLYKLLHKYFTGKQWYDGEIDQTLSAIEALCQDIAREARLDELEMLLSAETGDEVDVDGRTIHPSVPIPEWLEYQTEERIKNLTQQQTEEKTDA